MPRTINLGAIRNVLTSVVGRAALAWTNVRNPKTVWLARAGLSPLAIARNSSGALTIAEETGWVHFTNADRGAEKRYSRHSVLAARS
ncbi:MAG: hypothetical protein H0T78_00950 [Longispora sp.]|nr:hypothetical protein [Longispora sp. (in: high G+C Gram-positive bacteria)]